jgi:hypothetical protein
MTVEAKSHAEQQVRKEKKRESARATYVHKYGKKTRKKKKTSRAYSMLVGSRITTLPVWS